ncbi:Villin 4 isoform 1 [Dorcoceras hygrometricum]|uniref:Villin 4 isoform 1 n=1 Tax=Dorcoceras hygrometricum TaxID=472368 RepID=A0A2Z7C7R9_9LAMI|nr:Villin 4 isoform 1 [Dorcoceras hygrometricum]
MEGPAVHVSQWAKSRPPDWNWDWDAKELIHRYSGQKAANPYESWASLRQGELINHAMDLARSVEENCYCRQEQVTLIIAGKRARVGKDGFLGRAHTTDRDKVGRMQAYESNRQAQQLYRQAVGSCTAKGRNISQRWERRQGVSDVYRFAANLASKARVARSNSQQSGKPKRRTPISYGGRFAAPEKSQRSRSVSSFSPDRVRVRGRSPAFNALAANFENTNARNMSTPPPMVTKLFPRSGTLDSAKPTSRSAAIALITAGFEQPAPVRDFTIPRSVKASPELPKSNSETNADENSNGSPRPKPETILEDVKEGEGEEDEELPVHPYERLTTTSTDPVEDIDVTKREKYLSSQEFKEKFEMTKDAFYKLPKWKQNKLKMTLQLF